MIINKDAPTYVKLGFQFLVIFFICFFINVAQNILIPFAFAILLSILLLPVVSFFEKRHLGKIVPIGLAILIAILFIFGIIYFLSSQIAGFIHDMPSIKAHLNEHFQQLQYWVKNKFHISFIEQNIYLNEQADKIKEGGTAYVQRTFFSITETILVFILLPIYTFLLLYYRSHIRHFLFAIFRKEHGADIQTVIEKSKLMVRSYMVGLVIEMVIVAFANSIGLLLLGIRYAIFFGVMAAVLNIIPYVGMFTATLFTVLITLTTSNSTSDLIWIIIIFYGIHIIDVNILMPRIVASRLRINALISILGVIIGGALTGISGLFLSVPAIAFIKIICDQIDSLKPWGQLMGDETTYRGRIGMYHKLTSFSKRKTGE
ncbi:MAG: AI-2E family transporter [Bacteroidetes bacterium]|nr:AI-2E family transporter [Bacteroidota bacterium]